MGKYAKVRSCFWSYFSTPLERLRPSRTLYPFAIWTLRPDAHAIEQGVPMVVIADNCGTSVRMIEKTYAKILAEKRRDFIEKGDPSL